MTSVLSSKVITPRRRFVGEKLIHMGILWKLIRNRTLRNRVAKSGVTGVLYTDLDQAKTHLMGVGRRARTKLLQRLTGSLATTIHLNGRSEVGDEMGHSDHVEMAVVMKGAPPMKQEVNTLVPPRLSFWDPGLGVGLTLVTLVTP